MQFLHERERPLVGGGSCCYSGDLKPAPLVVDKDKELELKLTRRQV